MKKLIRYSELSIKSNLRQTKTKWGKPIDHQYHTDCVSNQAPGIWHWDMDTWGDDTWLRDTGWGHNWSNEALFADRVVSHDGWTHVKGLFARVYQQSWAFCYRAIYVTQSIWLFGMLTLGHLSFYLLSLI